MNHQINGYSHDRSIARRERFKTILRDATVIFGSAIVLWAIWRF